MYLLPLIMDCESTQWWIKLLILTIISSPSKQDPTIRLADGDERQGRVEVYLNGEWGTICDDRWDTLDGDVVCRQLGFLYAEEVMDGAFYGEGLGHVLMDEVTCDGTERTLFECPYSRHHNCIHSEDAGLVCSDAFDVRLVNGDEMHGLVEVYMDRQWGPVCADRWDIIDADIVCRQLGYLHAENTTSETSTTNGTLIGSVKCKGKENILSECSYVVHPNCTEGEISWVTCSAVPGVRLRGGEGKHEGRVEIHANGLWGTVCDEGWNIKDANVVCRQLGFSEAVSASREAYWEEGDSPILMSNVHCQGNEHSLLACASTKRHSCTHEQDAGVTCKRGMKKDSKLLIALRT
ncbi:Neurotrypsin [Holothuria leucospilota]|uniref:Neurotrypsin n=1 Tax=Holothuria leucospilota TaxID=206669 RepID=A0A9Q0YR80_HOLLE|nr:Neurotrypsin [Holothuria leucospilota]